jgi:hypothetical protein
MRSTSMELISSDAYLKGTVMHGMQSSALLNLKQNLRDELSSINMIKDGDDDDFDKYCQ